MEHGKESKGIRNRSDRLKIGKPVDSFRPHHHSCQLLTSAAKRLTTGSHKPNARYRDSRSLLIRFTLMAEARSSDASSLLIRRFVCLGLVPRAAGISAEACSSIVCRSNRRVGATTALPFSSVPHNLFLFSQELLTRVKPNVSCHAMTKHSRFVTSLSPSKALNTSEG